VDQGFFVNFTATASFVNGVTRNFTQRVTWASSDDSIATVSNEDNQRGRASGWSPGTVTISAVDAQTGISSTASGGNATLQVFGALERIVVSPTATTKQVGQPNVRFTATGFFFGGTQKNITQKVIYSSSNLNVAVPLNQEGDASLIDVVGPGTAVISATDPLTGVSSTTTGDNGTLTVPEP
jgi:hypothetical protein